MHVLKEFLHAHVFLYGALALGIVGLWRTRPAIPRRRLLWVTIPFVLLSILCMPLVCYFFLGSLEWAYPPLTKRPPDVEAIVVLAGYVRPPDELVPEPELGMNTYYRVQRASELYHEGKPCPIVVSGGSVQRGAPGPSCAEAMRARLLKLGVPSADIILEDRSQSTYENALECAQILRERRFTQVVLVTDATHLMRSELCFRKLGLDVIPCGSAYRATALNPTLADFVPDPADFEVIDLVIHEWVGLAWYWLRGRI
jgi:uncharacterized SAM-binding protein YcdF (DUF218 family)